MQTSGTKAASYMWIPGDPRYTGETMQRPNVSNCPSSSFVRVLFFFSFSIESRGDSRSGKERRGMKKLPHIDTVSRAGGERRRKIPHRQEAEEIRSRRKKARGREREEKVNGEGR